MAIGFNIQFRVNPTTQSYVIRLTDTSTGFTLTKGNFVINFPDGSVRHYVDFNTPDISAPLGFVDIAAPTDTSGSLLRGSYTISYITLDSTVFQRELVKTFNFDWVAPTVTIKNLSDSALPEVKFQDATSYSPSGNFTGVITSRTFSVAMPTTSAVTGTTVSTSSYLLDAVVATNYYEGVYTPTLSTVITYTHNSISGLTVLLTSVTTKQYAIKKAPTRTELVTRINAFRAIIDGYKGLNDTQFEILSEQYDILMALYFHLIERAYSATLDGSQDILNEILIILDPYTTYTYQSGPISAFYIPPLGAGTVTSVALTTPTGLTTSGSPITSSGTLAITLTSGYSIPTTIKQSNWDDAYTWVSGFPTQTGNSGKFLTTNGSILSWATNASGTVTSVGLSAPTGFAVTGSPVTASGTLALSFASGYSLPSDATQATWTAKQNALNGTGFVKASGTTISYDNTTYYPYPTGTTSQYVAGDGTLITFPTNTQSGTLVRLVRNQTGNTLTKGTVVYINGATGNNPTVSKALATSDSTSAQTFGLCQSDISNNATGYVVTVGDLIGIDTSAFTEGAQLYLSPTLAGTYTATKQYAPAHLVYIGVVTRAHPTLGQIEVKIQNGYELDEIHDVSARTPSNNDSIFFNSTTSLWENKSIATALGYTPSNDSLVVHLAGTETITGAKTFRGTTSSDGGILGSELAAVTASGANWSAVGANLSSGGYSHTAGATTDLTTTLAASIGSFYQITYTITSRTAGSITINYGGTVTSGITASGNTGPQATSTSALTITPTSDFNGTVVLSIKAITASAAITTFANSGGGASMEIRANNANLNTFIGISSGFINTTGVQNSFFGYNTGLTNTTGTQNSFYGAFAGNSTSTGTVNTFVGAYAGFSSNSNFNVAIGTFSLQSNTTGVGNTSIGYGALRGNITGNGNVALGNAAGRYIADGTTTATSVDASIFIGAGTRPLASGQTNQIVIGNAPIGLGSNTTVIGNSSTTTAAIYGRHLIGSTTDDNTNALQVTGGVSFKSLTGASDRVLYITAAGVVNPVTLGTGLSLSGGTLTATGTGTGSIGGIGTSGYIPVFSGTSSIANSNIQDSGSLITLNSNSYITGSLGIGDTNLTGFSIRISKNITGGTTTWGIHQQGVVQSDVTGTVNGFSSAINTQATSFTLTNYNHFRAVQGILGVGSAVTNQYGFVADSSLVGATNNFGFFGNISSASGRWNLYMAGSANNYLAGALGIGATSLTNFSLNISKNISGSAYSSGVFQGGSVQSDVTGIAYGFNNYSQTQAASFTLGNYYHFYAQQGAIGSGSSITTQVGYLAESSLTGATNNYGFYGAIPSGTNRWNLYMNGTADNYMAGSLGIGTTSSLLSVNNLWVAKSMTGGSIVNNIISNGTIQSDVTSAGRYFASLATTAASTFTVSNIIHFFADQGTIGASSVVTNQVGFNVNTTLTGATNNYGFKGSIPSAANNWNLYMDGTANNYMAGGLGIGATSITGTNLSVAKTITGATSAFGISNSGTVLSDVTSAAYGFYNQVATQAASFTLGTYFHYSTFQATIGSTSAITTQIGFNANSSLTGATNNYGFRGSIPSAANNYNLYMDGTANNYLNGKLGIGTNFSFGDTVLAINKTLTGGVTQYGIGSVYTIASDVTSNAVLNSTYVSTQAATFTLSNLFHYKAAFGNIGSGSAITNQYGFYADSFFGLATNNYVFYSSLASGTGKWNLYMQGTANNYLAGALGIGTTSLTGVNLAINKGITGATSSNGVLQSGFVNSDVTATAVGIFNQSNTAASTFTLTNYIHFLSNQGIIGSGSTITNQYGYYVDANMTGATNNYGFYGNISSGTNRWNIYINGTANNYLAGSLGIGTTSLTGTNLHISKSITGDVFSYGVYQRGVVQSDVTSVAWGFQNQINTQATTFTLPQYRHYSTAQGTIGVGSTVTNQYGFYADNSLIGATNNFGFFGNLPSGANNWNIYMSGTANNYMAGSLGIGATGLTNSSIRIDKNITGSSTSYGIWNRGLVKSDVSIAYNNYSELNTEAGTYTVSNFVHYMAVSNSVGANSTVTSQSGFQVSSNLTTATNNYAFRSDIASGSNRWNLYMAGTADNYLAGSLGIGTSSLTGTNLNVVKNLTGAVNSNGVQSAGTVQSDVTTAANYYTTYASTQATAFTLTNLRHFYVSQGTIGAGSSVTNQYGFIVDGNMTGATNDYGFYGDIASGTGRWNLYMNGTANNYLAGSLGIGTASLTGVSLGINKSITGATSSNAVYQGGSVLSDVTNSVYGFNNYLQTQAASFTLGTYTHYYAQQGPIGSGSAVTYQVGFWAHSSCIGATNNYGFYGQIPSAANNYNLYMAGTANNYLAGSLGVGTTSLTGTTLSVSKNITGSVNAYSTFGTGVIQSDVTNKAAYFSSYALIQNTAFSISNINHFEAVSGLSGSATITNQIGFLVGSSLTQATNNFGFYGQIPSAANNYNLYMAGTANNYLAGSLGIGTASLTGYNLRITKNLTGGTSAYGSLIDGVVQSDVTAQAYYYQTYSSTQNTAFTLPQLGHFFASGNSSFGSSTVSIQTGFWAGSALIGAVTNYGFRGQIASSANRWNLYMDGTAQNYLAGALSIGVTTANASALLQVDSTTQGVLFPRMTTTQKNAISSPAAGLVVYDTTLGKLCVRTASAWETITSS